jgi:hypothetical protein
MEHPGYDLYFPKSAAAHLGISQSFFRESVEAPVIMGAWGNCLQHVCIAAVGGMGNATTA